MSSTKIQQPRVPSEQHQHLDKKATPATTPDSSYYVIGQIKNGQLVHFDPTCQLLTTWTEQQETAKTELSFSSSRLLEMLIRRADTVVSREDILTYAWPNRVVTQSSLNQAISSIREQLGDDFEKKIIQTMPRRGYQFNSRFLISIKEWLALQNEAGSIPSTPSPLPYTMAAPSHRIVQHRHLLLLALIIFLLVTLVLRINFSLFLQPNLVISNQQAGHQQLIYTATNKDQLSALQTEVTFLQEKLLSLPEPPSILLFNRMYSFYDIICISQESKVFSMLLHESQLSNITDQQLLACAK